MEKNIGKKKRVTVLCCRLLFFIFLKCVQFVNKTKIYNRIHKKKAYIFYISYLIYDIILSRLFKETDT